jgi:hypothetical protein
VPAAWLKFHARANKRGKRLHGDDVEVLAWIGGQLGWRKALPVE